MRVPKVSGVVFLVILGLTFPQSLLAQELGVLRAQSLDRVFAGAEAVAQAAGYPLDRQMMLSTALGMTGIESGELLDMSKPVAVVLPVEGMMLQQKGLVAAIPVTDVAAAIALVEARFASHTSEDQLHTFSTDQGPAFYLLEADGYIRIGGSSDLVSRFDPLAGQPLESAISLEIFLEPVAPMLYAGMEAARQQIQTQMERDAAGEDVQINPEAIGSVVDLYVEGARSVINSTSRIGLSLDVKDGYLRFSEWLIAKPGSSLAEFTAAQKGARLEIARLADPGSAFFAAGSFNLSDENRATVKELVNRYFDAVRDMFDRSESEVAATEEAEVVTDQGKEAAVQGDSPASSPGFWSDYFDAFEPYTDRWMDCLRGDFVVSLDFTGGLTIREAFGLTEPHACQALHTEMSEHIQEMISQSSEMASVFTISSGPELGSSTSMLMAMDILQLAKTIDPGSAEEAEEVIKSIYGERLTIGWASIDEWIVITGGESSAKLLQEAYASRQSQAKLPSFKPLNKDLSVLISLNLGRLLAGLQTIVPAGQEEIGGLSQALSGETGHIPMGLSFGEQSASFELAVPLKTIEAIASFAAEMEAKEQAAEPHPTVEDPEG